VIVSAISAPRIITVLLVRFAVATPLRGQLVYRFGDQRYLAFYSASAVVAFAWLIIAYLRAPALVLWATPGWAAALLLPVALVGSVLIAAGLSTPNPVIVRQGHLFDQADIVRGILRVSRNPFFWGAGLLSLAQVIALGDVAAILGFGSIAFLGIIGSFVLDAKKARPWWVVARIRRGNVERSLPRHHWWSATSLYARDRAASDRISPRRACDHACL
jgi:uncharacterized membrane protein